MHTCLQHDLTPELSATLDVPLRIDSSKKVQQVVLPFVVQTKQPLGGSDPCAAILMPGFLLHSRLYI